MPKKFLQKIIPGTLFVFVFITYLTTLYPTIAGEDSAEFVTVAANLDLAHPPGYPLYTMLGKVFTIIIPFGNIAWRINIMSALFAALTSLLIFLLTKKITQNKFIPVITSLAFSFTNPFWSQAIRAEVYTLNTFLFSSILLALHHWYKSKSNKPLYLSIFLFGITLTNHHLILLAAIPFAIFVISHRPKLLLSFKFYIASICSLALGLLPYLYLPIRTVFGGKYINPAMISHHPINSFTKFWAFVNRNIYGGSVRIKEQINTVGIIEKSNASEAVSSPSFFEKIIDTIQYNSLISTQNWTPKQAKYIFQLFFEQYYFVALIPFIFGLFYLLKDKKNRAWNWMIILLTLIYSYGLYLFISLEGDTKPSLIHNSKAFIIPGLMMLAIVSGYGIKYLFNFTQNKKQQIFLITIITTLLTTMYAHNYKKNDQSGNYIIYDYVKAFISSIPDSSPKVFTYGRDDMTFSVYYLQEVEKFQPQKDVRVVYTLNSNEERLKNHKEADKNRKIYTDLILDSSYQIDFRPNEMLYEVLLRGDNEPKEQIPTIESFKIRGINATNLDYTHQNVKAIYLIKRAMNYHNESDEFNRNQTFSRLLTETPLALDQIQWVADFYEKKKLLKKSIIFNQHIIERWPESGLAQNALQRLGVEF